MKRTMGILAVLVAGCSSGGSTTHHDLAMAGGDGGGGDLATGPDLGMAAIPAGTIQGLVKRGAGLTFSGDGKGTLWVDIGPECPYPQPGPMFSVTKTAMFPNGDLAPMDATIPFTMTGVAAGTYAVWAWLDDNGDANPLPSGGDPGDFPMCPMVTLTASAGASVELTFDSSTWN
jgi:hypothetical protein